MIFFFNCLMCNFLKDKLFKMEYYEKLMFYISDISDQCYLLNSFSTKEIVYCFIQCSINSKCQFHIHFNNECKLYSQEALKYLIKSTQSYIYSKEPLR